MQSWILLAKLLTWIKKRIPLLVLGTITMKTAMTKAEFRADRCEDTGCLAHR